MHEPVASESVDSTCQGSSAAEQCTNVGGTSGAPLPSKWKQAFTEDALAEDDRGSEMSLLQADFRTRDKQRVPLVSDLEAAFKNESATATQTWTPEQMSSAGKALLAFAIVAFICTASCSLEEMGGLETMSDSKKQRILDALQHPGAGANHTVSPRTSTQRLPRLCPHLGGASLAVPTSGLTGSNAWMGMAVTPDGVPRLRCTVQQVAPDDVRVLEVSEALEAAGAGPEAPPLLRVTPRFDADVSQGLKLQNPHGELLGYIELDSTSGRFSVRSSDGALLASLGPDPDGNFLEVCAPAGGGVLATAAPRAAVNGQGPPRDGPHIEVCAKPEADAALAMALALSVTVFDMGAPP